MKIIRICVLKRPEPNTPSKYLYYVAWPLKFEIQRNETNMLRVTSGILAIIKQNKKTPFFCNSDDKTTNEYTHFI